VIDRMIAEPAKAKPAAESDRNPHAGAASATPPPPSTLYGPKAVTVERTAAPKDALDEAAELFRVIFKGDIVP